MVFLISILLTFLSNPVNFHNHAQCGNYSGDSGISILDKSIANRHVNALIPKLNKIRNKELEKNSKFRTRINTKRYFAISGFSGIDLKNQIIFSFQNFDIQIYAQSLDLHPNSLRAPPVFYCI